MNTMWLGLGCFLAGFVSCYLLLSVREGIRVSRDIEERNEHVRTQARLEAKERERLKYRKLS